MHNLADLDSKFLNNVTLSNTMKNLKREGSRKFPIKRQCGGCFKAFV